MFLDTRFKSVSCSDLFVWFTTLRMSNTIDIDRIVKDHACQYLQDEQKKLVDLENPIISWEEMNTIYGETTYNMKMPTIDSHILVTNEYENDTPFNQSYSMKAERRTKASYEVSFRKKWIVGADLRIKLGPLNPILDLGLGLKMDFCRDDDSSRRIEKELVWSIDNQIMVSSKHKTSVDVILTEEKHHGVFTLISTFDGTISVAYFNKKTKELVGTVREDVKRIFVTKEFSKDSAGRPTFQIEGECNFKIGIKQLVKVTQAPL
uniref:Uncharacterized protein n=1 Tax=Biomphalaria glabrata TaxID=6526 RepID=A0A2C9KPA0_BIOGL